MSACPTHRAAVKDTSHLGRARGLLVGIAIHGLKLREPTYIVSSESSELNVRYLLASKGVIVHGHLWTQWHIGQVVVLSRHDNDKVGQTDQARSRRAWKRASRVNFSRRPPMPDQAELRWMVTLRRA